MAATAMVLTGGAQVPAAAESVTLKDHQQRYSQGPALDLKKATLTFDAEHLVFVLHVEKLSKKRTQVFGTLSRRSGHLVRVKSWYDRSGTMRVQGSWSDADSYGTFKDGVSAAWDFGRDVVTLTISEHLDGNRGVLGAYTVAKGALHGPSRGDYITAKLRRG